jgi:hypothetical protein
MSSPGQFGSLSHEVRRSVSVDFVIADSTVGVAIVVLTVSLLGGVVGTVQAATNVETINILIKRRITFLLN